MEVQITIRGGTVGSASRRAAETRARGLEKYDAHLRRVDHGVPRLAEMGSEAE